MTPTNAMIMRACAAFDDGVGDPNDGKRRMEKALRAALTPECTGMVEALKEAQYFIQAPAEDLKDGVLSRIREAIAKAEARS